MSDLNDLIHTNAVVAFEQGVKTERQRIITLLKPLAEHSELCQDGCYPEDCSAPEFQHAISLIQGKPYHTFLSGSTMKTRQERE